MPLDLKDARYTQLYEHRGDKSDCDNHHGISLLNIFSKIVLRIILPKVQVIGQRIYLESQCGYKPGRATTDMTFSVGQLQENCREKSVPLCIPFVDLTKA